MGVCGKYAKHSWTCALRFKDRVCVRCGLSVWDRDEALFELPLQQPVPGSRMQRRQELNLAAQAGWREKSSGSSILGCTRSGRLCRPSEQVFRVDWPCVQRPKADLRVNLKYPALELRAQNPANLYMYRSLMELR
jgi:hypothetical protein